jgi:hypothetical protein
MERIIFKAKAGKVFIGEDDREATDEEKAQCNGVSCQDDFADYSEFRSKLKIGHMSFKFEEGTLFTVTEFAVKEDLTSEEIVKLMNETQGQWSDGIGEGFEQFPCAMIGDEEVFISPWFSGQEIQTTIE